MALHLNLWAPKQGFSLAYNPNLTPVTTPSQNLSYFYEVDYVRVSDYVSESSRHDDLAGLNGGSIWYTTDLVNWHNAPGYLTLLLVGDFDGDGRTDDLAGVADNGTLWYTTNLSSWTQIPGRLSLLVTGDFDGDGRTDDLAGVADNGTLWYTTNLSS